MVHLQVLFDSVAGATVFESISVDANQLAINKDMILSPSNDSLYLMSANMVHFDSICSLNTLLPILFLGNFEL